MSVVAIIACIASVGSVLLIAMINHSKIAVFCIKAWIYIKMWSYAILHAYWWLVWYYSRFGKDRMQKRQDSIDGACKMEVFKLRQERLKKQLDELKET